MPTYLLIYKLLFVHVEISIPEEQLRMYECIYIQGLFQGMKEKG